jgi:hypothetical protein
MNRAAIAICVVLLAESSHAEIGPKELTLAGMSDCLKEAIGRSSIDNNGSVIFYSCSAATAKTLYNFLGRKVRDQVVKDTNGKFDNRQFGNSACYHRVEDASGKATDDFTCDLVVPVGDVLSD